MKEVVAEQALELRLLKKSMIADGDGEEWDIRIPKNWGSSASSKSLICRCSGYWKSLAYHAPHFTDRMIFSKLVGLRLWKTNHPSRSASGTVFPDDKRGEIVQLALDEPELSPRELATHFTDTQRYFVSEASVYRLLKEHDLIASPAYIVMKAANEFKEKTTAPNQLWQTDFTCLKVTGWGWFYLSTILDDFSRYIIAWKLCTTMKATDVTETLNLALQASGLDEVHHARRPRLLSDNGPSYISSELADRLGKRNMSHVRGAPCYPQTQGKIERWHQTLKNRLLLENYYLPGDLEANIEKFVEHYNHRRYHESLDNLKPADVYFGRGKKILIDRERIKRTTIQNRRLQHQMNAA